MSDAEPGADPRDTARDLPDDWESMSQDEREAWAEAKERELHDMADEATSLSDAERDALDALADPIEEDTATVELNGQTVEVRTYLDAEREDALNRIENNTDDLPAIRETLATTLAWLVVDDRYGGDSGRKVWRAYAEKYGASSLAEVFYSAVEPALDRMENSEAAQRFRGER